jgi:hypothetical protein
MPRFCLAGTEQYPCFLTTTLVICTPAHLRVAIRKGNNMPKYDRYIAHKKAIDGYKWRGTSKRTAKKGKRTRKYSDLSSLRPVAYQVGLETLFSSPCWVGKQYK